MPKPLIYLDNCCYNRPFDDQTSPMIRMETAAKLDVQELIRSGEIDLVWSFALDYENECNPFEKRRVFTESWARLAQTIIPPLAAVFSRAVRLHQRGIAVLDALHLSCAAEAGVSCFLTTDKAILKKRRLLHEVSVKNPIDFMRARREKER
jgi:hypothetical protein